MSINAAVTLDGKIATAARRKFDLSSREDRRRMADLRRRAQAVIIGAGTLRAEDPPPLLRAQRRGRRAPPPAWVILTRGFDLPTRSRLIDSTEVEKILVGPRSGGGAAPPADPARRLQVWRLGSGAVDPARLLERLAQRGARRVVVEGGAEVNAAFLEADLVDEIHLTLCPYVLGGAGAPTVAGGAGLPAARRMRLVSIERLGEEIFLRYRRSRP